MEQNDANSSLSPLLQDFNSPRNIADVESTIRKHKLSETERVLCFSLLFIFHAFGSGFQNVPIFAFLGHCVWLTLLLCSYSYMDYALLCTVSSAGNFVAYMKLFGNDALSILAMFGVSTFEAVFLVAFVGLPLNCLPKKYVVMETLQVYIYPVFLTSFYSCAGLVASSWTNPAYAFMELPSLYNVVTLFGLDGVNFFLALGVSICTVLRPGTFIEQEKKEQQSEIAIRNRHLRFYLGIMMILFAYGGSYDINSYGRFYQTDIISWNQEYVNAVCMIGYESNSTLKERLDVTESVANRKMFLKSNFEAVNPDVILWSETATMIRSEEEECTYLNGMQEIAKKNRVMIGVTYLFSSPDSKKQRNMFSLVLNNGSIAFKYQKVHPVFIVEKDVEAGKHAAPVIDTGKDFGKVGGGICFDFDFPRYINRASNGGNDSADLMLQPGWDWDIIGILHAKMDATRALENGFTLFRCSSGGVSGVYSPYFTTIFEKITGTKEGETDVYATQIPKQKRLRTLYSYIGGLMGYLCTLTAVLLLLLSIIPKTKLPNTLLAHLSTNSLIQ